MLRISEIALKTQATSNLIHNDNAPIKGIRAKAGATSEPSMSFADDPDTGIFNPGSNIIGIVAGSNMVIMASPSNVKIQKQMVISSNIIPADNATQYIGTSNLHFKEAWIDTIHISQNTLYLGDTPVLGTESDSIAIRADADQSINVKTTGLGVTNLVSTKGVNVAVTGLNSVVDIQSSGAGGRVVMGASNEISLNAPTATIESNLTVKGNLTVNGTQFTANVQTVEIKDNILLVNKGQTGSGVSAGYAGIRVDRGDAADYDLVFNESTDKFEVGPVGSLVPIATETYVTNAVASVAATEGSTFSSNAAVYASNTSFYSSNLVLATSNLAITKAADASNVAYAALPKSGGTLTGALLATSNAQLSGTAFAGEHNQHQFVVGTSDLNGKIGFLYDTQTDRSYIQSMRQGVGGKPLHLNFAGGNVFLGRSNASANLEVNGSITAPSLAGACISSSVSSTSNNVAASSGAVKSAYDIASTANTTASNALPKSGGTLTGALTGTSASFNSLSGTAISDSVSSTSSNVAASSAAVKTAYDIASNALPNSGGTLTGALTGTSASFNSLTGTAISDSVSSTSSNVAASSAAVKTAYDIASNALPKSGGTLTGALTGTSASFNSLSGTAISDSVTSTSSNVAASSAAVKSAYDSAISANAVATNASNVATSASNQAFGIASLSNGDVLLTGNLRIPADANIYKGTDVFSSGGGGGGTSGIVSSASNIVPTTNGTLDLGAPDLRWRNLYLSGNMISFGNGMNIDGYSWSYLANYVVPPRVVANTVSTYLFTGAAQDHSAYVRNGELFVCGRNDYGQLGLGHTSNMQVPTKVPGIANAALVACGERFTVCVKTDGTAVSAGLNANGQLGINSLVTSSNFVGVAGVSNATAVAAGYTHTLFMTSDGKVVACGSDANGQLGRGASSSNIVANSNIVSMLMPTPQNGEAPSTFRARSIAAGGYHSTVLLENGSAYLCGKNDQGQCGASPTLVPQANTLGIVPSLSNVVDVACGHEHTLFVRYDGQVVGFGRNDSGQLGQNNKVSPITSFVQVMAAAGGSNSGLSVQVAAGFNHSAIIKADNTIWMVGANDKGQLGLGQGVTEALTLTQLVGYAGYDIACGRNHTVISTTPDPLTFNYSGNNALIAFGDNTYGQMGDNNPNITTRWFPNRIHDGTFRKRLMVGSATSMGSFVDADGVLYVTGTNGYGQLGDETTLSKRNFRPVSRLMNEGRRIVAVACGANHTIALDSVGKVHAWGLNSNGEIGRGNTTTPQTVPINISEITGIGSSLLNKTIVAIACGSNHTLALDSTGKVHAWGNNGNGQLGRNNTTNSSVPINISEITGIGSTIYSKTIVAIACGGSQTLALDSTGKVHAWGFNGNGRLGNNSITDSLVPINISEITGIGSTLLNKTIVAIACGGAHTLALDSLGKVHAWGRNLEGQLGRNNATSSIIPINISEITGIGSTLLNKTIVAIACGDTHTLALDSLGNVHAWGYNANGRLGNNSTTSSSVPIAISEITGSSIKDKTIVAIACGGDHTLALDSLGKVHAWGYNNAGRLGINSTTNSSVPVLIDKTARDYHSRVISTGRGNHKLLTNISASTSILKSVGSNSNRQIGDSTLTDRYTPVDLPTFASAIVSTSESLTHSAVALANGEVWCWGANGSGQCGSSTGGADVGVPTKVIGITNAVEVACGDNFTLVRNADDTVMAFGLNTSGQLGIGSTTSTHTPTLISTLSGSAGSKMIAAGSSHAASVDGTGTLRVWGSGALGKLGLGNVNNVTSPTVIDVSVFGFNKVTHVSLGDDHTVVVCSEATGGGVVYTTGLNDQGQLGRSDGFELVTPGVSTFGLVQNMPTSATPLRAACGAKHTALHVASDRIVTFGSRVNRQTTVSTDAAWMPELVEVIGEGEVAYEVRALSVSSNATHVEMPPMTENESGYGGVVPRILTMGTNKKWGRRSVIGKINGSHSIVVTSAGIVYAAGYNYFGQLGNNIATASTTTATSQVNISGSGTLSGKTIVAIAGGDNHTVALDSLGKVHAWGANGSGQLGRGTTTSSSIPIAISEITGIGSSIKDKTIVAIASGDNHTLALDSLGNVHAWGDNAYGQLGRNNTTDSSIPINISEITGIGSSLNGKTIVAIACGSDHTLALDSLGKVHAWGLNGSGRLGNGTTTSSSIPINISEITGIGSSLNGKTIVAIACGGSHTLALDSLGNVHAWGDNISGQLGRNNTTDSWVPIAISEITGIGSSLNGKTIVAIACGNNHTLALDSLGNVHAWGDNGYGQLGRNNTTNSNIPINISGITGSSIKDKTIVAIACGANHTLALDSTGRIHVWGANNYSQVASGTTNSLVPILSFGADTETVQNLFVNFTGQHRCFVDALAPSKLRDHEGLVVVTDKNAYASGLVRGRKRAMAINQALPLVSLSRTSKDPRAFGVISLTQDHPAGPDASLSELELQKIREEGDIRVQINSIGEGCIWVCEEGGILKAGDYVTTSSIPGYAMQQLSADDNTLDNTLRNYTVAKLTMDCDFTQPMIDVQEVQKDEYGNVILDASGAPVYATVLKKDTKEVVDPETGMTKTEELDILVPETEPAYDMRWLDVEADGTVKMITKEQYEERKTAGDTNVTRAAFVGCTYHCG